MITITCYYFDLVTPPGALFSGHAIDMQMMGVSFSWRSALFLDNACEFQRGMGKVDCYEFEDQYHLKIPAFNLQGIWDKSKDTEQHHLIRADNYRLIWQGLSLNGMGSVTTDDHHYQGKGYVEKLTAIFNQLSVPYTQFRWGRFISEDCHYYAVWITFNGDAPKTLIIDPDGLYESGELDWVELRYNNQIIRCSNHREILETQIGDHLPPWMKAMFPGNLALGTKRKWISEGQMIDKYGKHRHGWIVEEDLYW